MTPTFDKEHGIWISVSKETPKAESVVFTLTEKGILGLSYFTDDEYISLMPTYMGEPNRWLKNPNGGVEILNSESPLEMV